MLILKVFTDMDKDRVWMKLVDEAGNKSEKLFQPDSFNS